MTRRSDQRTERLALVERGLRGMFRKLANRPVPEHIQTVVDQLEAADQPVKQAETA